jgi:hypothetical protein
MPEMPTAHSDAVCVVILSLSPRVRCRLWILHVVLPIFVGAAIYVSWRSPWLLVFTWIDTIGVAPVVADVRAAALPVRAQLPSWVLFSLPDALWVYAVTWSMALVWNRKLEATSARCWVLAGGLLACSGEVGQALRIVPGTFDVGDVLCYVISANVALWWACRPFTDRRKT